MQKLITEAQLRAIFPRCDAALWAPLWSEALAERALTSREQIAGLCGIVGNETGGLTAVKREDTRWTAAQLLELFPRLKLSPAAAEALARTSRENRAAVVYAHILGNGDAASGDGWRYRGGGLIQLTGRDNYAAFGKGLGLDLEAQPELIEQPRVSIRAACWFVRLHRPRIALLLDGTEESFLEGARMVGWTNKEATARRLAYRRTAMRVLAGEAPPPATLTIAQRVQEYLAAHGHYTGLIDGLVGPLTRTAIRSYRRAAGLPPDDTIDAALLAHLGIA